MRFVRIEKFVAVDVSRNAAQIVLESNVLVLCSTKGWRRGD